MKRFRSKLNTVPRRTRVLTLLFGLVLIVGLVTAAPSMAKPTTPVANWTQQTPAESPPVRQSASMAYDPAIGKVVLFGGVNSNGGEAEVFEDTWTYDGTTWTEQSPATSPPRPLRSLDGL